MLRASEKLLRLRLLVTALFVIVIAASCAIGVVEEADENRRGSADKPEKAAVLSNLSFGPDTVFDRDTSFTWQRVAAPERLTYARALTYCRELSLGVRPDTAWAVGINSWMNGNPVEASSRVRCLK